MLLLLMLLLATAISAQPFLAFQSSTAGSDQGITGYLAMSFTATSNISISAVAIYIGGSGTNSGPFYFGIYNSANAAVVGPFDLGVSDPAYGAGVPCSQSADYRCFQLTNPVILTPGQYYMVTAAPTGAYSNRNTGSPTSFPTDVGGGLLSFQNAQSRYATSPSSPPLTGSFDATALVLDEAATRYATGSFLYFVAAATVTDVQSTGWQHYRLHYLRTGCGNGTAQSLEDPVYYDCAPPIPSASPATDWFQCGAADIAVPSTDSFSRHKCTSPIDIAMQEPSHLIDLTSGPRCLENGTGPVDFNFFQMYLNVSADAVLGPTRKLTLAADGADDGTRVTIFNSANPNGCLLSGLGSYAQDPETDFTPCIVKGEVNRVVFTQMDTCEFANSIQSAKFVLGGSNIPNTFLFDPDAATTPTTTIPTTGTSTTSTSTTTGTTTSASTTTSGTTTGTTTTTPTTTTAGATSITTGTTSTTTAQTSSTIGPTTSAPGISPTDLAVSKSDGVEQIQSGVSYTFSFVVTNQGSVAAQNVVVTDSWPASYVVSLPLQQGCVLFGHIMTCSVGVLPAFSNITIRASYTVAQGIFAGSFISNCATVSASNFDPIPSNNEDCDRNQVSCGFYNSLCSSGTCCSPLQCLRHATGCNGTLSETFRCAIRGGAGLLVLT